MARSGFQPKVVIDIGAAKGTWTEEVKSVFPSAIFILIDPLPENLAHLHAVAKYCDNARVVPAAVGANTGIVEFFVHGDQSSFLKSEAFAGELIKVPVRTCDDIIDEVWSKSHDTLNALLKIDVQGYEIEVLKGAKRTLENTDALLVEVSVQRIYEGNPLAHEVIAHLGELGFCIFDIVSYVQRPHDRALTQVDILFVRETSPLMGYVGWR